MKEVINFNDSKLEVDNIVLISMIKSNFALSCGFIVGYIPNIKCVGIHTCMLTTIHVILMK